MKLASLLLASLSLAGSAFAVSYDYVVYSYSATVNSNATVSGVTFAAGDTVTGQLYLKTGIANTSTWIYVGETGQYVDAVKSFSFVHEDLAIVGSGLGSNFDISNNRRLVAGGNPAVDALFTQFSTEPGNTFTETLVGDGASYLQFNFSTNFVNNGNPVLNAVTGVGYPSAVNVALFDFAHTVTLGFANNSTVTATVQSVSIGYASAIPEPSSFAALAGLGAIGLAATRRRRCAA